MYSFKSNKGFLEVKDDLEKSFDKFSIGLKYCITCKEYNEKVLEHQTRGAEDIEKMMGILWSISEDTITATPKYNLYGSARGLQLGPLLKNMSEEEVQGLTITRMTFLRLSAQTYNKLANVLGPLMFSTKVLSSRACELASVNELNEDLAERDQEFVAFCKQFILNLRNLDKIIPFHRCWVPPGFELVGFVTGLDGGKAGYGSTTHALAEKTEMEKLNHVVPTPLNNGVEETKEEKPA